MNTTSTSLRSWPPIASELISDLGAAMAEHIVELKDPLAHAPEIQRQLARAAESRRAELERFVHHLDAELRRIPGDPDGAAAARRELAISVHPVQVDSKLWLIDELTRRCDVAASSLVVLGGWYGMLPLLVNWRLRVAPHMVSVDNDPVACETGVRMIGSLYPNIEFRCNDVMDLDYDERPNDSRPVVINTICEHLPDPPGWLALIPRGQLVALQSNNYEVCPDHVSCVHDLDQFQEQMPLSELLFAGVLQFPELDPELDRFMLIGRR
jgi:hypothetical protein